MARLRARVFAACLMVSSNGCGDVSWSCCIIVLFSLRCILLLSIKAYAHLPRLLEQACQMKRVIRTATPRRFAVALSALLEMLVMSLLEDQFLCTISEKYSDTLATRTRRSNRQ